MVEGGGLLSGASKKRAKANRIKMTAAHSQKSTEGRGNRTGHPFP